MATVLNKRKSFILNKDMNLGGSVQQLNRVSLGSSSSSSSKKQLLEREEKMGRRVPSRINSMIMCSNASATRFEIHDNNAHIVNQEGCTTGCTTGCPANSAGHTSCGTRVEINEYGKDFGWRQISQSLPAITNCNNVVSVLCPDNPQARKWKNNRVCEKKSVVLRFPRFSPNETSTDQPIDMCADPCADPCMDPCADPCVDPCADPCAGLYAGNNQACPPCPPPDEGLCASNRKFLWFLIAMLALAVVGLLVAFLLARQSVVNTVAPTTDGFDLTAEEFEELLKSFAPCSMVKDKNYCSKDGIEYILETRIGNDSCCVCKTGYSGPQCKTNIDECSPQPCMNGGTCVDNIGFYICVCDENFSGPNCEIDLLKQNECDPKPCLNGGTCTDGFKSYNCTCAAGFNGINCETKIKYCDSGPCQNNATCQDGAVTYFCKCLPGFDGRNCQYDIDFCKPNPCAHNETCVEINGGTDFNCTCLSGFDGKNCSKNIDDCEVLPCDSFGTTECVDGVNNYTCNCYEESFGPICEFVKDSTKTCLTNKPCNDGGQCVPVTTNTFTCACFANSTGKYCDKKVTITTTPAPPLPCARRVCVEENTIECINIGTSDFNCTCKPGYEGKNCSIDIDYCIPKNVCENGECFEGESYFVCACYAGWDKIIPADGKLENVKCDLDIDECGENNGDCGLQTCVNTIGSFFCE